MYAAPFRNSLIALAVAGALGLCAGAIAQTPEATDVDLNQTATTVFHLLRGLVRDDVSITCSVHEAPAVAHLDALHLEQALINLALNAEECLTRGRLHIGVSMEPTPGCADSRSASIRISGWNTNASESTPSAPAGDAGPIASSDLNLGAAYAIVRRNGGSLSVDHRPSTVAFTILFPAVATARGSVCFVRTTSRSGTRSRSRCCCHLWSFGRTRSTTAPS